MILSVVDVTQVLINGRSEILVFGRSEGKTVAVFIYDVPVYIYVAIAKDWQGWTYVAHNLEKALQRRKPQCSRSCCPNHPDPSFVGVEISSEPCPCDIDDPVMVRGSSVIQANSALGFERDPRPFLKLQLARTSYMRAAKDFLSKLDTGLPPEQAGCYGCVYSLVDVFMRQKQVSSWCWLQVNSSEPRPRRTRCDVEFAAEYANVAVVPGPLQHPAPSVLCLDIETITLKFTDNDPIGMVAVKEGNAPTKVLAWGGPVDTATPHELFASEKDMLKALLQLIVRYDPDILTGFNSNKFDYARILARCRLHGLSVDISRMLGAETRTLAVETHSNQKKGREDVLLDCPGRVFLDALLIMLAGNDKFRTYKLKVIAEAIGLAVQKDDVEYSEIYPLFHGTPTERGRLLKYCGVDVDVTAELIQKREMIASLVAECQVKLVTARECLCRASTFCFGRAIYSAMRERFLVPDYPKDMVPPIFAKNPFLQEAYTFKATAKKKKAYKGAFVFEPKTGLHRGKTLVMDFASMYPSIMRERNLSTELFVASKEVAEQQGLREEDIETTLVGCMFVKKHVRQGILPDILYTLMCKRDEAKAAMKNAPDAMTKNIFNARQQALKVQANSIYGLCGTKTNKAGCIGLSASVTSYGSKRIQAVSDFILSRFPGTQIIYGDTDSVMILLPGNASVDECRQVGRAMEQALNDSGMYTAPMRIEFEKIFSPYLLLKKKIYCGCKWSPKIGDNKPMLHMSGVEAIRRDKVLYVSKTMEGLFDLIMMQNGTDEQICAFVEHAVQQLLTNNLPISMLVLTAGLSKPLDKYTVVRKQARINQASHAFFAKAGFTLQDAQDKEDIVEDAQLQHVAAARLLRDAGFPVDAGDRIEYIYIARPDLRRAKAAERAFPLRLWKDQPIDYEFYASKLQKPMINVLQHVIPNELQRLFAMQNYVRDRPSASASNKQLIFKPVTARTYNRINPKNSTAFLKRPKLDVG